MRRGDIYQSRWSVRQFSYDEALVVCPTAYHASAMSEQAVLGALIVWILDDDTITGIHKHALGDRKRLLCASDDQNIRGIANDSAAPP